MPVYRLSGGREVVSIFGLYLMRALSACDANPSENGVKVKIRLKNGLKQPQNMGSRASVSELI